MDIVERDYQVPLYNIINTSSCMPLVLGRIWSLISYIWMECLSLHKPLQIYDPFFWSVVWWVLLFHINRVWEYEVKIIAKPHKSENTFLFHCVLDENKLKISVNFFTNNFFLVFLCFPLSFSVRENLCCITAKEKRRNLVKNALAFIIKKEGNRWK